MARSRLAKIGETHKPMKTPTLPAFLVLLTCSALVQGQSIGINFNSDRDLGAELGPDESAGHPDVAQTNWNSTNGVPSGDGGSLLGGNPGTLIDSNGVVTGVTVTWASNGTWNTNNGTASGDNKLMNGYIDHTGGFSNFEISNISYPNYDVYVYFGSDGNGRTGAIESVTAGQTFSYTTNSQQGGGFPGTYVLTEDELGTNPSANYCVFRNQSSPSFVAQINRGSSNSGFHGVQVVATAPPADVDNDGLLDSWETANGLDPSDDGSVDTNNGAAGDPDNDGSANLEEFERGTDPQDADSDGDGLSDGVETATGIFVSESDSGSNPLEPDSDGDGLSDGAEINGDPFVTDPNNPDTDSDGFSDSLELEFDADPTDANSRPVGGDSSIGINFLSNRDLGAELLPDELAGHPDVAQANWNNTSGAPSGNESSLLGGNGTIVDSEGNPSAVTVAWASNGTWNTNNGSGTGDNKLMNGYIDHTGGFANVEISNITYANYDVYVYFGSDGNGRTGAIESTTAGQTFSYTTSSQQTGGFPGAYVLTEDEEGGNPAANYCVFRNQSSGTFSAQVNRGSSNSGFHGIQVVATEPPQDADNDGLIDSWEQENGLASDDDGSVDPDNGPEGDPDGDGSPNLEEFTRGTDPQEADSDGDGLLDGAESGSGVFVGEADTGTDPLDPDSDGDGLVDGEEVATHQTDPNDDDSDDDRIDDGDELQAGTNPNDANSKPPLPLPIGYWSFDDQGAGGTTADLSNEGNDGTLNGGPEVVDGPCGPGDFAFKFDGFDDFIGTGASLLTGLGEYTMSGWVKFETAQTGNRIGLFGQNDAVEFGLINPSQLQHWTSVGGALDITVPDTAPWTHVLVTGDATGRTVYLGGVQAGTGPSSLGSGSTFPFNIGGGGIYDATGNFFSGCIDEVAVWDKVLTEDEIMQLATCEITPLGRPRSQVGVEITEFRRTETGEIQISWKSSQERQYDILSNAGLDTPRAEWAEVAGAQDIQGDASGITTAVVAPPFPETGYLIVREEGLPALFEDDFETDTGWTPVVNDANGNTNWERGAPNGSTGPLTGADGSANAWCTNLGDFGTDSDISLRSPVIDLTSVAAAELSFDAYRDGDGFGDVASVRFLRASDQVQLGEEVSIDMTLFDADWTSQTIPVALEAVGESIVIEFNFVSDSSPDAFSGLSIDNVVVAAP